MLQLIKNKKLLLIVLVFVFLITTGAKCGGLPSGMSKIGPPKTVTLNYFKVYEESSNIQELISLYKKSNPHIRINYYNFSPAEYELEILNSLAEDRGPDIFSIHTTWMKKYLSKIQAMPSQVTMKRAVTQGTLKKETYTQNYTKKTLNLRELKMMYPDTVYDNQVINNKVYGLPLSIDSLVLFYNKDLLNNAGIQAPPRNWDMFMDQVSKLTKRDAEGNIIQAGVGLGTANNVQHSTDILSLLMMQTGTPMSDSYGNVTIDKIPAGYNLSVAPAVNALNFYNSFASPANEVYTWNKSMPNSRDAFATGISAFYIGYAYDIPVIRTRAPKLSFEVTEVPQLSSLGAESIGMNFANYWVETVSKKSDHYDEAWDFILFITANAENNKKFISKSRKPVALRDLLDWQREDITLAPFANQLLTAKSWYNGSRPDEATRILKDLIADNLSGFATTQSLIKQAVKKMNL